MSSGGALAARANGRGFVASWISTRSYVTTSLSTRGGPVNCVHSSEGRFQEVVYPLGLRSGFYRGVTKSLFGYG